MKTKYKIAEVARLFNIPVATLHYWEKEGLFSIRRNGENQYRDFEMTDILNIWEVVFYRGLNISIGNIRSIMQDSDADDLRSIYQRHRRDIGREIKRLQDIQKRLDRQVEAIDEVKRLAGAAPFPALPDFTCCVQDAMQIETMQASLLHSYDCGVLIGADGTPGRMHIPEEGDPRKTIWRLSPQWEYREFLLKMKLDDANVNNLREVRAALQRAGYRTGRTVARFLLVLCEKEERYEYYKAWMEVTPGEQV